MTGKNHLLWMLLALAAMAGVDLRLYLLAADERESELSHARERVQVAAQVVAARVDQQFDTFDRTLSGIGEVLGQRTALSAGPDLAAHRLLLRRHAITPGLRAIFLIRPDGSLAETSLDFPAKPLQLADRPYFKFHDLNWEAGLYVGALAHGRVSGDPFIPISRAVTTDGGRFLGVIAGALEPTRLESLLQDERLPAGYAFHLILEDRQALVCLPKEADCERRDWRDTPLVRRMQAGEGEAPRGGAFDLADLREGDRGPAYFARVGHYPMVVVASARQQEVLAHWRGSLTGYLAIGAGSNIGLAGLTYLAYRQSVRRRQALNRLAEANHSLEQRVLDRTEALRLSEARARMFMNTAPDAVVIIDDSDRIVEFNGAAESMFGYRAEEILGQPLTTLIPPAAEGVALVPHPGALMEEVMQRAQAYGHGREVMALTRSGRQFPVEVTVGSPPDPAIGLHVGIIRDISERKRIDEALQLLATTDGLTGVLNRRAFTGELDILVGRARRHGDALALLMLDADRFKTINDTWGHPTGDRVLKALTGITREVLRSTDLLGRLGGEEFGIALPQTPGEGARQLAERLQEEIRRGRVLSDQGEEIRFSVSMGLVMLAPGEDMESLMRRGDEALYQAKSQGRDQVVVA